MKKRISLALLSLLCAVSLTACANSSNTSSSASTASAAASASESSVKESSAAESSAESAITESSEPTSQAASADEISKTESSVQEKSQEHSEAESSVEEKSQIEASKTESSGEESSKEQDVSISEEKLFNMIPTITDEELKALPSVNKEDIVCYGRLINNFSFAYRHSSEGPIFAKTGDLVRIIYKQQSINKYIIYLSDFDIYKVQYENIELLPPSYTPDDSETVVGF